MEYLCCPFRSISDLCSACCLKPRPEKRSRQKDRDQDSEAPPPMPTRRKRALTPDTIAVPDGDDRHRQFNFDQQECFLFSKLPLEIRYLIYQAVLAPVENPDLHVCTGEGRLLTERCYYGTFVVTGFLHRCWGPTKKDGTKGSTRKLKPGLFFESASEEDSYYPPGLGLLQSCRKVYVI